MTRADLADLLREALQDPRRNAERILAWPLPQQAVWLGVLLVSVLAVLGLYLTLMIGGNVLGPVPSPFGMAALQVVAMIVLAAMMAHVGRMFGGSGRFAGALRIMVWLQGMMVAFQAVQLVAMVLLPPLAGLLSLASVVAVLWVATGFVAGLHGFRSLPMTFLGIIGSFIALGLAVSMVLAPFITVPQ
jgi:hypothetical protein